MISLWRGDERNVQWQFLKANDKTQKKGFRELLKLEKREILDIFNQSSPRLHNVWARPPNPFIDEWFAQAAFKTNLMSRLETLDQNEIHINLWQTRNSKLIFVLIIYEFSGELATVRYC